MLNADTFFDLSLFSHREIFSAAEYVWDGLKTLKSYMDHYRYHAVPDCAKKSELLHETLVFHDNEFLDARELTIEYGDATKGRLLVYRKNELLAGASVIMAGAVLVGEKISLGKGVKVEPGAFIASPAIIGDMTEIRQGAYLRGYCLIGSRCVVGHVTEVKHSIFLDDAKAGHFAYLGDSILGNEVNLGAGTKLANLRFTPGNVTIRTPTGPVDSGLRKLGAILADSVQTGCNSVTNPGTLLGKKSLLLPNTTAPSGLHEKNSIIK
jgi:NDP-sugar pyrophosphorylase family protein